MAVTVEEAVEIIEDVASFLDADVNSPNVRYFAEMLIIIKGQKITHREWDKIDPIDRTIVYSEKKKGELISKYRELINRAYDEVRSRVSKP